MYRQTSATQTDQPALPRRPRRIPDAAVHLIRERFHIDGRFCPEIRLEVLQIHGLRLSRSYIHRVAIADRCRNVPLSPRLLAWLSRTGRPSSAVGM